MKPPVCAACPDATIESSAEGGNVRFRDYQPLDDGVVGHPDGLEWFCAAHLPAAKAMNDLPAASALPVLRGMTGNVPAGWWFEAEPFVAGCWIVRPRGPKPKDVMVGGLVVVGPDGKQYAFSANKFVHPQHRVVAALTECYRDGSEAALDEKQVERLARKSAGKSKGRKKK